MAPGQPIIPNTRPRRVFRDHKDIIHVITVFRNGRRMVTVSDRMLYLRDLKFGAVLKKMEGHRKSVLAVAVSGDGKLIASGDLDGEIIAWNGDTGECLIQAIEGHLQGITSLDFSPDNKVLATVSWDRTIKLWNTDTWQNHGNPTIIDESVLCVRYSPSGRFVAIATNKYIQIWNPSASECIATFTGTSSNSLTWTPNGTRLLSSCNVDRHYTIREWDTSSWKELGDPWIGHSNYITAIAIDSTGTLAASASHDGHVRLWRISNRRTIAIFDHSYPVFCVAFSADGKFVLCGDRNYNNTEWGVPEDAFPEEEQISHIIPRDVCVTKNLSTTQELLTQEINLDRNDHIPYAYRSCIFARKCDWDNALHDALDSISIQPSFIGYVSKAIAFCGKTDFIEATKAFDLAFTFTDQDSNTIHILLLIKAITLFKINRQEEAEIRIQEIATVCSTADITACYYVEAYLRIQLGLDALNDKRHDEAVDHFNAVIFSDVLSYCPGRVIHSRYEIFMTLFGWDLMSSWQTAHQNLCRAFLQAGRLKEAQGAYNYMMATCDEATKASCHDWSIEFKKECSVLYVASADTALAARAYDKAIELYSAAIDLNPATDSIFANRCKAKLGKMLWEEALIDAQRATEIDPSSYIGYHLQHEALHGGQRYSEAIEAFEIMLFKLDNVQDLELQALRRQYISPSEAQGAIRTDIHAQMEDIPPRLLSTSTGHLCDREAQINAFITSPDCKGLLSSAIKDGNLQSERIKDMAAMFFQYVTLSHRWEGTESLQYDIRGKSVYDLHPVDGTRKLQSFCKIVRDAGYRWAWVDTCCIDQNNNVEIQRSVNSTFAWYRHSALTIIYLSDVAPSSKSGAMARSAWNTRGWTVPEFLAPKVVLFYQKDWTLYLDDRSANHKESPGIMRELEGATGINIRALTTFRPGMMNAREKLRWSSRRITMLPEDIAYSLFGLFGVYLPVIYGETKQNALGRLLQEVIDQSGDISCLDWVGKSSTFNSCLPANITSYAHPPFAPPSLSEDEMQTSVSSLRDAGVTELVSQLYATLYHMTAPRFARRRLLLPCIVFAVTQVTPRPSQEQKSYLTYAIKATGLYDLLITTEDKFSRKMPIRQRLLLVRPWDRNLLQLKPYDIADVEDDTRSITTEDSPPSSPSGDDVSVDSEPDSRAMRLIVRLGQPFRAFLLAQRGREYCRIAADRDIIAQVKDMASVCDMMDVRTVEIS